MSNYSGKCGQSEEYVKKDGKVTANQRSVYWSRDYSQPIRYKYSGHVKTNSQSEASITHNSANQRHDFDHVISIDQSEASIILTDQSEASIILTDQSQYWERRRKNNLAAKKSRDSRRIRENQMRLRVMCLENANQMLKEEMERKDLDISNLK